MRLFMPFADVVSGGIDSSFVDVKVVIVADGNGIAVNHRDALDLIRDTVKGCQVNDKRLRQDPNVFLGRILQRFKRRSSARVIPP